MARKNMTWRTCLQDHPAVLVWAWQVNEKLLAWLKPLLARFGADRASRLLRPAETAFKRPVFDCQECGQCVLHYTGMTCPMTCPKTLRNGPCGGVRADGHCEVYPERACVWVKAYERAQRTPYARELRRLNPPVDARLRGLSSWVTFATGQDQITTGNEAAIRYADEVLKESPYA
jgi:hypothetical protein